VSFSASERGGHARPPGPAASADRAAGSADRAAGPADRATGPADRATGPADSPAAGPPTRPGSAGPPGPGPRPAPPGRQARRSRIAALAVVAIGVLVIGLATGFGSEPSAEPAAQAFLFDWQQQHYAAAGALTTTSPGTAAAGLEGALAQLDATQTFLTMNAVTQHGGTAEASFTASVDLAQGRVWTYKGRFGLRRVGAGWKVEWAPSVVYPGLNQGERLAVLTRFPNRAPVLDSAGRPLQTPGSVYVLGVWPGRLGSADVTARKFADLTGLQAAQVLGLINAAPPYQFLRLASLDPATYASLRSRLRHVPGLVVQRQQERLFQAEANGLVGQVGSEVSPALRADGAFYLPGTTIGLSGLEQTYQRELLGTPTTEVVLVNSAGVPAGVLAQWPGAPGAPVRTTINSAVQRAALAALDRGSASGEIVAVQASTGQVLAVAQRRLPGSLAGAGALDAKLMPGTAFTIVSTAALLGAGLKVFTPISCENSFTVDGQTFTSDGTGAVKPFSDAFANGCGTAFAGLSERLSPGQFAQVVKEFGIGADWSSLPVPAFSGSVPSAMGVADLAAEAIGQGNVRMSPLAMAVVAAAVDTGSWHTPQVTQGAADPAGTALNPSAMSALRGLMRTAVHSGAAQAASVPGAPVYGQIGLVRTGSGWLSWFVGFRGGIAFTVIESGKTSRLSAAALAGAFLSAVRG
jgi:Penicillin binding protein transpeptidase domain/NTF2-like N-terminal transpeptidase domain/Penicillin-binding Protein dimerisation domain